MQSARLARVAHRRCLHDAGELTLSSAVWLWAAGAHKPARLLISRLTAPARTNDVIGLLNGNRNAGWRVLAADGRNDLLIAGRNCAGDRDRDLVQA